MPGNAASSPVPLTVIQPARGLASLQLRALWEYRELLLFLALRDVKVRYKQTVLGVAWILLLTSQVLWLPLFLLLAIATALGFGLWLSALNVRSRDVTYLIPFLLQLWMYTTPVVYGAMVIPERFRWVMALNPMTGVVEGFRATERTFADII